MGEEAEEGAVIAMNRAANGLVIHGVSKDAEAAIMAAHTAFLRRRKLKIWSLAVVAKGERPSVSITSTDPDGGNHYLDEASMGAGVADEIAQMLDDHYHRYSQAHSAAKGE